MGYEAFDIVINNPLYLVPLDTANQAFVAAKRRTHPPKAEPCLAKPLASRHIKRAQKFFSAVFAFSTFTL